jgi:hypothetical protein
MQDLVTVLYEVHKMNGEAIILSLSLTHLQ